MFHCKALIYKGKSIVPCFLSKKLRLAEKTVIAKVAPQVFGTPRGGDKKI
jgi:hypothetical protein